MSWLAALLLSQVYLSDEGGPPKSVKRLDFSGAGVTCSASSTAGSCVIPGGVSAPSACSAGQAVTSNGAALTCTSTVTASDVVCAGTCVSDAEISAVAGGKVSGAVATATALAADPADCSAGQYATNIAASGALACAQVAASQLSGTVTDSQISDVATTKLTGTLAMAQLGTTSGVASASTFLRGDGTWANALAPTLSTALAVRAFPPARVSPLLPKCNLIRRVRCRP